MLTSSLDSRGKETLQEQPAPSKSSMVTLMTTPVNNDLIKKQLGLKTQYVLPINNMSGGGVTNRVFSSNRMSTTNGGATTTTGTNSDRKFYTNRKGSHSKEPKDIGLAISTRNILMGDQSQGQITLNQIKKTRRIAETDVQKMHNRIRMLQIEEERALKKIEETRRKAKTILEVRMNKEQKVKRHHSKEQRESIATTAMDATSNSLRPMTPDVRSVLYFERKEEHKRIMADRLSLIL